MAESSRVALVERLRSAAADVFADTPVAFAYVFGSRVAGNPRPDSDVDIAVVFASGTDISDRRAACLSLAGPLQRSAGVGRIEALVDLDEVPLAVAGRALRDGVVIHSADDVARVRHYSRTMRQFGDHQLHEARHLSTRLAVLAEG